MKNTALNTLGYTGLVTISQYIGKKKQHLATIHNQGKNPLFNFLSDCLVGNFDTAKFGMPSKIKLLNENESSKELIDGTNGFISLRALPSKDNGVGENECSVIYSFVIPRDRIVGSFNRIALYSSTAVTNEEFSAICKVEDSDINSMTESANLVIDWQIFISNKEDASTESVASILK